MHPNVPHQARALQPDHLRSDHHGNGSSRKTRSEAAAHPWDLLLVAAAALILIAVGRIHSFFPPLEAVRPALAISLVGIIALALRQSGARKLTRLKHPITSVIMFIVLCAVVGTPFGIYPGNSFRFLVNEFLRTIIIVVIIAASVRDPVDLRRLLMVYALGAIAFSLLAQGTGGFRDLGGGGYDPNDAAMFIVSGIPLVFLFLLSSKTALGRLIFGVGLISCVSAVVLSGSRGGFLALLAVLGFSIFFLKGIKPILRLGIVAAVLGVLAFQATGDFWDRMDTILDEDDYNRHSITGRIPIWTRGMGYMAERPLLGVGVNNFPVAEGTHPDIVAMIQRGRGVRYSAPHSIWIQTGAELGVPALVALLALFGLSGRHLIHLGRQARTRHWRHEGQFLHDAARPFLGVLLGIAVAGTFLSHAYSPLLWVGFAFVLATTKFQNPSRALGWKAESGLKTSHRYAPSNARN